MGRTIGKEWFTDEEYQRFSLRLQHCLIALRELLTRPGFGEGETSIGAELELALVDAEARPLPMNLKVLGETVDPRVTVELDRFNLECNLRPTSLAGRPLTFLRREIDDALTEVRRAARAHGGRIAVIGILPTLRANDLQSSAMTDHPRYRVLSEALRRIRQEPFRVRIDGADPLEIECDDVTFEGAATSLQVHLRVTPTDFAALFNAAQIATAPVLAVAGNSPTFLGRRLWEETRVALFQQAVDDRGEHGRRARRVSRVSFGTGWVAEGAWELFAQAIALHEVLLPVLADEDPLACVMGGRIPRLEEVRLHQGTVWSWNRPIYDPADGGHLRIEMRALPAGPTTIDMLANTAFLVGLTLGLAPQVDAYTGALPFEKARRNFYRAAQSGLEATIAWPDGSGGSVRSECAERLIPELLPLARRGLADAGVETGEIDELLAVISERCARRRTGAAWQQRVLADLDTRLERRRALAVMLERYLAHSESGEPVHTWPFDA
jgi:gamma-glutamyl:cysteine ligase YbdK (ATP-grasp superfamily)